MSKQIQINLPGELYDLIRQMAQGSHLRTDDLIVRILSGYFFFKGPYPFPFFGPDVRRNNLPPDIPEEVMKTYSDAQLWSIVDHQLTKQENKRLDNFLEERERGSITQDEELEITGLIDKINHQMFERTKALMILQERGYDIPTYIKTGKR